MRFYKVEMLLVMLRRLAYPSIWLFVGSFMIARAITLHNLDQRISLNLLSLPMVDSPRSIVAIITFNCVILSAFISNVATTSMMFSIVQGMLHKISEAINIEKENKKPSNSENEEVDKELLYNNAIAEGGDSQKKDIEMSILQISLYLGTNFSGIPEFISHFLHFLLQREPGTSPRGFL